MFGMRIKERAGSLNGSTVEAEKIRCGAAAGRIMMKAKTVYRTIQTAVTAVILMLSACEPEAVPVNGVTLDRTTVNMMVGESVTLKAVVAPANATVKTVHWSGVPAGAATVKDHGDGRCTVTVEKEGSVTVLAATADGGKAAGCRLSAAWPRIGNTAFIKAVDTQCGWTVEPDGTVKLTPENRAAMAAVTELSLAEKGLTDISGIEYFTGLTTLLCYGNQLTELDVSANTALTTLDCCYNQLTDLDVSANTALTTLKCFSNQLTDLDVAANTALTTLDCCYNQLTELDVKANMALVNLSCHGNQLTELDVSANTNLGYLMCGYQNDGPVTQNLDLFLTAAQKTAWENNWGKGIYNDKVTVKTAE